MANISKGKESFIAIAFFTIVLLIGITVLYSDHVITDNARLLQHATKQNTSAQKQLMIMSNIVRDRLLTIYAIAHSNDVFEQEDLVQTFHQLASDFIVARTKLESLDLQPNVTLSLINQKTLLLEGKQILETTIKNLIDDTISNTQLNLHRSKEINRIVIEDLARALQIQINTSEQQIADIQRNNLITERVAIILLCTAFITSVLIIVFVLKKLSAQDVQLTHTMNALEEANQSQEKRIQEGTTALLAAREENIRVTEKVSMLKHMQQVILPRKTELQVIKNLDIATFMLPADDIGGDYFDVFRKNDGGVISIGDVTGHGLASGIIMLMVQSIVRHQLRYEQALPLALTAINETLYQNITRMKDERCLSLMLLDYTFDHTTAQGHFSVCGQHESVIIIRSDGQIEEISTDALGFPVGMLNDIEEYLFEQHFTLYENDLIVLYTDGIPEATNQQQQFYGMERFLSQLQTTHKLPPDEIQQTLMQDLSDFVGDEQWHDDVSLVLIKQVSANGVSQ